MFTVATGGALTLAAGITYSMLEIKNRQWCTAGFEVLLFTYYI